MKSPLKWHGGKYYLRRWIRSHFPKHLSYVEAYFGGGEVLFAASGEGVSEVVNDLNHGLTNFWRVLQDDQLLDRMRRFLETVPFSSVEYVAASKRIYPETSGPDVQAAANFFIVNRQSRQGLMADFATISRNRTRRGMNEQVSSYLSAIEDLPTTAQRMRRVLILQGKAVEVIRSMDGPEVLFFLDPPYVPETRVVPDAYAFEMTVEEHIELLDTLADIKGRFVLCGYYSQLYEQYRQTFGWKTDSKIIDNKASAAKVKGRKIEMLWMNFDPPAINPSEVDDGTQETVD